MASPLGLTDFTKVTYSSDNGNPEESGYTGRYNSIFNGTKFFYRPIVDQEDQTTDSTTGESTTNVGSGKRHQPDQTGIDDLYDISTNSIIDYTQQNQLEALRLRPSDFAYLRDFGVYPNNRLAVVRRFRSPVENDLTSTRQSPISTIVSWIPDEQDDFFSFTTNEEWKQYDTEDPLGDLTDIFNRIFKKATGIDIGGESNGMIGGMANLFPIGGIAEALQTTVVNYFLGDEDSNGTNFRYDNLPFGNPNFMGESAYREMGSIRSEISIPVKVVYELKYINNVDPTIVFMDIIQNLLRFSSSQSVFYISQSGGRNINEFFNKYKNGDWIGAIKIVVDAIVNTVKRLVNDISNIIDTLKEVSIGAIKSATGFLTGDGELTDEGQAQINSQRQSILNGLATIGASSLARYRIEFAKIIPAATGAHSAPWHLTLGNPKNPFFSSGDMIVESSEIKMGNVLGFNDLPTRIEFNFTVKSARNLGIQEIFDKFNVGAGRQYQRNTVQFETDFYQGSVKKVGGGTTNPATGAGA